MDFQFELNFDDVFEGHIKNEDTTFAEETLNISNEEIKIKEPPLSLYDFRKDENEEDKSSLDLKPDVDIALKREENHDTSLGMQDSSINEQICQSMNDVSEMANQFLSADKNNEVVIKKEPIKDEFIDNKEPSLLENIKEEVHWEEATETLYSIPPAEKPIIESGKPPMAICMSVGNSTSKEIQKFTTPQNQKSFNLSRNSSKLLQVSIMEPEEHENTEESFTTSPVVAKQKTGQDVTRTKKSFEEISMQVENESPSKEKNVSANEPRSATPKKNLTEFISTIGLSNVTQENVQEKPVKQSMETQAGSAKVVKKRRSRLKNNNKGPTILEEGVSNRSMRTRSRSNKTTDIPLAAYCRMINKSINQTMDVNQDDAGVEKHPSPISKDKTILNSTKTVKHTKKQSTTSTADLNISKSTTKSTQKQPETNQTISENQLNNTRNTSTRLTRSRLKSNKSLSLSSFCNQLSTTLNLTGNIENVFNVTASSESQTNNTIDKSNKTFPVNTNSKSKSNQQNNKTVTLPQSNELQKAYDISGQTDNLETTQNVSTNKRTSTSTLNKYTEESFTTSPVVVKQKTGKDVTRTKKSFEEISMQVENESPSKEKNVSANEPRSATPKKNLTDTSINTKRKGRVCFTKKEEENLLEGVKKYGFGCWAKILKNYHFNPCRANVSLKDKYRTLQNQGKV